MKKISILVSDDIVASSVTGPMDMFNVANAVWQHISDNQTEPLFDVSLVSQSGEPVTLKNGVAFHPKQKLSQLSDCEFLLIGAYSYGNPNGLNRYIRGQQSCYQHIRRIHHEGGMVGGYCSATFTLASSGLLDGIQATTSWFLKSLFAKKYPDVELVMDKLVVEQNGIWTAGASTSYLDLCLKVIEKLAGQQIASGISKVMLLDINRASQLPFMNLPSVVNHNDNVIAKCQDWIQKNLANNIHLDDMSNQSTMSKRNFIRRFKKAVGETPATYLQQIRVEAAKRYLETTDLNLEQIIGKVGYDDLSAFRRVFQKMTSLSPKEYRVKFATQI
ncbi:GlxA family transcriptional regulator [Aliikangiella coralliicola]|uniref:Helix-turn-helix domain-containing protein n=1 Tax=Aliikangiella coralliicola TaxID=2592383 RepID=A0A545UAS5_9GAMM|nr:helix-turn-helix domain-containing protein [Aliikangiella coralliicola]TQV86569.1 helix-turn-helix domain-containing protein [Aliikangiella coralliicola]